MPRSAPGKSWLQEDYVLRHGIGHLLPSHVAAEDVHRVDVYERARKQFRQLARSEMRYAQYCVHWTAIAGPKEDELTIAMKPPFTQKQIQRLGSGDKYELAGKAGQTLYLALPLYLAYVNHDISRGILGTTLSEAGRLLTQPVFSPAGDWDLLPHDPNSWAIAARRKLPKSRIAETIPLLGLWRGGRQQEILFPLDVIITYTRSGKSRK